MALRTSLYVLGIAGMLALAVPGWSASRRLNSSQFRGGVQPKPRAIGALPVATAIENRPTSLASGSPVRTKTLTKPERAAQELAAFGVRKLAPVRRSRDYDATGVRPTRVEAPAGLSQLKLAPRSVRPQQAPARLQPKAKLLRSSRSSASE